MQTTLFVFNVIWALLGTATFIFLILSIRISIKNKKMEYLTSHLRYIDYLRKTRDLYRSYGNHQAADNLDHDIRQLLKDLKL